jgi:hypothetical protein
MFQTLGRSLLATMIAAVATLAIVAGSAVPARAAIMPRHSKCVASAAMPAAAHTSRAAFFLTLR